MKTRLKFTETQLKDNVVTSLFGFEIKVDVCFGVRGSNEKPHFSLELPEKRL